MMFVFNYLEKPNRQFVDACERSAINKYKIKAILQGIHFVSSFLYNATWQVSIKKQSAIISSLALWLVSQSVRISAYQLVFTLNSKALMITTTELLFLPAFLQNQTTFDYYHYLQIFHATAVATRPYQKA